MRARQLRQRFGERIIVVQADASDLRRPRRPFKVVANPPFAITQALMRRVLSPRTRLLEGYLIVSRQVARRWLSPTAPGPVSQHHPCPREDGYTVPTEDVFASNDLRDAGRRIP